MKNETELIREFSKEFNNLLGANEVHLTRIESNYTEQGIPDLNVCCVPGTTFWVEFKIWPNELGPLQLSWHAKRRSVGGIVYIVTYLNEKGVELYLLDDGKKCIVYKEMESLARGLIV